MTKNSSGTEHRLIGIDLMRFVAAFLVMFYHLAFWSWAPRDSTPKSITHGVPAYPELIGWSWFGWVGVYIFFVISGFVIAYSAQAVTAPAFLRRRFLRLFPAALICATITLLVYLAWGRPLSASLGPYFRAVILEPFGPWIDGVYWTLGIEISFYAVVLLLLWIGRAAWIEATMAIVGATSAAFWLARAMSRFIGTASPARYISPRTSELLLLDYGMYFALGVFLWLGFFRAWTRTRLFLAASFVVAGLLPLFAESASKEASIGLGLPLLIPPTVWLAAMVVLAASIGADKQITAACGRWGWGIRALGLATYPLYLLHDVVGAALLAALSELGIHRFVSLALVLTAMTVASVAITLRPERAVRRIIGDWIDSGLRMIR